MKLPIKIKIYNNNYMENVTIILNGYKRLQHLEKQLNSVRSQTIQPHEIFLWQNGLDEINNNLLGGVKYSKSNTNFGVWARFAYALNAKSEYLCVVDDDTILGNRWIENCLNTIKTHNGLLGTIGVIFNTTDGYYPIVRHGWAHPNEETVEVDIVGHAWFFRREWLSYMWRELPNINDSFIVGEDMHFSHMLWKYGNIKTFVPPHPKNDKSLWGSLEGHAIGSDSVAISMNQTNMQIMNVSYLNVVKNGYVPLLFRK
jgi:glycosyltransferase involved in cell wall biosynthesis